MIDWKFHANLPWSSSWLAFHGLMARLLASQMTFLTLNGLVGASAEVVRGQNIARIAKAALQKLLGKSSLNVSSLFCLSWFSCLYWWLWWWRPWWAWWPRRIIILTMMSMATTMNFNHDDIGDHDYHLNHDDLSTMMTILTMMTIVGIKL